MQDFGGELATGPSQSHNRDFLQSIELKDLQRNSSLAKFFHTLAINPCEFWPGFVFEEDQTMYIGFEDDDRISEE